MRTANITLYRDKRREWRWKIQASNGKILADSAEGYKRVRDCRRGLVRVLEAARTASVIERLGHANDGTTPLTVSRGVKGFVEAYREKTA